MGWWYTVRNGRNEVVAEDEYESPEAAKGVGCYYMNELKGCTSVEVTDEQGQEIFRDTKMSSEEILAHG